LLVVLVVELLSVAGADRVVAGADMLGGVVGAVGVIVVVVLLSAGATTDVEPCALESLLVCAETKPAAPKTATAASVALNALEAFMDISFRWAGRLRPYESKGRQDDQPDCRLRGRSAPAIGHRGRGL
jgi:hypothetical protein